MRSGILVGVLVLLSGCEVCPHSCPANLELTLVLADGAGKPLTPRTVVDYQATSAVYACGDPGITCVDNRITVRIFSCAPQLRVEATTGQRWEGALNPEWLEPDPSQRSSCCPATTATAGVTLQ